MTLDKNLNTGIPTFIVTVKTPYKFNVGFYGLAHSFGFFIVSLLLI